MKKRIGIVSNLSLWLNNIASTAVMVMAILTVLNVLLRVIFKSPILGTYEYVRFLQLIIIGGAIAYCGLLGGHVAVDFLIGKFPSKILNINKKIIGIFSTIYLLFISYYLFQFGNSFLVSGEVSVTLEMPFYPFIWFISFTILVLAIIELKFVINKGDAK